MSDKKVKDKHITRKGHAGLIYLATVEYYQDRPFRDEHFPVVREFSDLKAAQKFLEKYPRDVWDGLAHKGRKQPIL